MSSNDLPRIRQALFLLDKNRNYKFDVNQTITVKNLKKMIIAAANLGKSGLKIFHKGTEYTHLEDSSLGELFPDLQLVEFTISVVFVEEEDKEENIKLKLGKYCPKHNFKYPYFYCYDCKASICSMCLQEGIHKTHNYIEKYDYLQSSRNLVESIFYDMKDFLQGAKFDNTAIEEIRSRIKVQFFPQLIEMVTKIELKLLDLLDFFFENEKASHSNMQQNVGLLKSHCSEGLDKLKNEIAIEDMMLDEDIFLTFDRKFKEISSEKGRIVNDSKKFEELRKNITSVVTVVDTVYNDIYSFLDKYLKDKIFNDTKTRIAETSISLVTKEDVLNRLLSDIKRKGGRYAMTGSKYGETPNTLLKTVYNNIGTDDKVRPFPNVSEGISSNVGGQSSQQVSFGTFISQCVPNTNEIILYDNSNALVSRQPVVFSNLLGISTFLPNCSYLNVNGKLYISGGLNKGTHSDSFLVYDHTFNTLTRLADLPTARHSHSMFYHNDFIFVVGGSSSTTEKFDTKALKWTKLASLVTEERFNPVLYVHNNYLYAFFGMKNGTYLDTVEKLNLKNVKSKWELVPYKKLKDIDLKMTGCGIITSGDKEIYLFGGKSKDGLKNSAVKFDFSTNSFDKVDLVLEDGIYFHESLLADLGDSSYGQFNTDKNENFFKVQLG